MKFYALFLFAFLFVSLAGVTLLGLTALNEVSAIPTLEAILAAVEDPNTGLDEAARLAADQLVFGERHQLRWAFQVTTLGILSLIGLGIFAALGYRRLVGPLRRHALNLATGKQELDLLGEFSELAQLVVSFNVAQKELGKKERGEMAKYVVHQMRNLWTPVQLAVDTLRSAKVPGVAEEAIDLLLTQSQKATRLLGQFQGLYTFPQPRLETVSWALALPQWLFETRLPFTVEVEPSVETAWIDPFLMAQSIENLVRNAWEAQGQAGPPIEIRVGSEGIWVSDRGCGFSCGGKPKGLGLGLAFVRQTALAHGMSLDHQDRLGGGSIVRMLWMEKP